MPSKRKTAAEPELDAVQDPQPDNDDDCRPRPKRVLAGKGGAARQLEKCADAITREDRKRTRLTVPSNEQVNKMAPLPPKRRYRQGVKRASELSGSKQRRKPSEAATPAVSSGRF